MREILLDTAVDHFGRRGFEGAATRAIAAEAGTAMSSITYHFGSKEGLYLATAEHIAQQIETLHRPALVAAAKAAPQSREEAIEVFIALLDSLAVMLLGERSAKWARFMIREQQEPTEAFDCIYFIAMGPMVEVMLSLLAIARPDLSEAERRSSAFLLVGQAFAMRAGRASMCRMLGKSDLDAEAEDLLRARIRAHARCILFDGPETDQ